MLTLHPSSTATALDERLTSLSAPTADPLWMLARQWQTGGLLADDGGTPVTVRLAATTRQLTLGGQPLTTDLAPLVEAEPAPQLSGLDTRERVRLSAELFRRLSDSGIAADLVSALRTTWTAAYALAAIQPDAGPLGPVASRLPDVETLITVLQTSVGPDGTGPFPALPGMPPDTAVTDTITVVVRAWFRWVSAQLSAPSSGAAPPDWDVQRLAYSVRLQADPGGEPVALTAVDYDGAGFDWYSFDRSTLTGPPGASPAPITVQPAPVSYPGMPQPGYWTLEDGDVRLDPQPDSDPAQHLLASFAHAYANDWFVIPLTIPAGICLIADLQVTDTFGVTTTVPTAAAVDGPDSRWQMWELSPPGTSSDGPTGGAAPPDSAAGLRLFLPHHPPPLQGPALEDVLVARDELANLAWVVELTTRDGDGTVVDRYRRWLQHRPPHDPNFNPQDAAGARWYRLGTTVPDHWYPLMAAPGTSPAALTLADLPDGATDVSDGGVRGTVISHSAGTSLADDAVTRAGTRITRVPRLSYQSGRTTWTARTSRFGTGEASSGLRFDVLDGPATAETLPRSPDLGPALRTPPHPLVGTGGAGSALRDWWLWNNADATTRTWLTPTTRTGGWGWMLHVVTTGSDCGVVQQWGPTGSGPTAAASAAWVYVLSGQVHLGAGNGGDITIDAVSTSTDRWELLRAANGRAPVNEVVVYSHSGPAEFLLDRVDVFPARSSAASGGTR